MKNNKKNKIVRIFSTIFSGVFLPVIYSNAAIMDYTNSSCRDTGDCELSDFVSIFAGVYDIILGIVGSIALLMIVIGGVMFLISGGNQERVVQGKKIIVSSFIGLLIVFASYLIIRTVLTGLGYYDGIGNF